VSFALNFPTIKQFANFTKKSHSFSVAFFC